MALLQSLVQHDSYTRHPAAIVQQNDRVRRAFAQRLPGLLPHCAAVDAEDPAFGPHLLMATNTPGPELPTIALVSHLDTVYPAAEVEANGFRWVDQAAERGRVVGPGTMDIHGGTVCALMALRALVAVAPAALRQVRIAVLLNAAEEEMATDFPRLCAELIGARCPAVLVLESGRVDGEVATVVGGRSGRCVWRLTAAGREAHAGNGHREGVNAIVALAEAIVAVSKLTDYPRTVTVNVGTVRGGRGSNSVPDHAECEVEMRCLHLADYEAAATAFEQLCHSRGVACERTQTIPPWPPCAAGTEELVKAYTTVAQQLGCEVAVETRAGGSDGNWHHGTYPVLDGLGPSGANAHCSRSTEGADDPHALQEQAHWPSFALKAALLAGTIEALSANLCHR